MNIRKYYHGHANHEICYKNKYALGILATPIYKKCLYIYEEQGIFHEFFSGIVISNEVTPQGILVIPESTLRIRIGREGSYGTYNSYEMDATSFVEEVKRYINNRELIAQEIQDILLETHIEWVRNQKYLANQEEEKKQKEQNSERWLDNILNSRK